MSEEVKEKLFSEIGKGNEWVRPEHIYVIKRTGVDYAQYWSENTKNFGPLLEATTYDKMPEDLMTNGEVVEYREVVGVK